MSGSWWQLAVETLAAISWDIASPFGFLLCVSLGFFARWPQLRSERNGAQKAKSLCYVDDWASGITVFLLSYCYLIHIVHKIHGTEHLGGMSKLKSMWYRRYYCGHLWKQWRHGDKRVTEDEMVGRHHQLNGHEFEQTLGDSEGQGSLACCSPWGCKELDRT